MAVSMDLIKRVIIQGSSQGLDKVEGELRKIASSADGVTVSFENASRSQLSAEAAYKRLSASIDPAYRSQQQIEKGTNTLNRALQQGRIDQDEYTKRLKQLKDRYTEGAASNDNFTSKTKASRYELINLSRQIQDVGVSLASGQSPFTVLAQQGSQIYDVFASSSQGAKGLLGSIVGLITPARLLALGVTGLVAGAAIGAAAWKNWALALDDASSSSGIAIEKFDQLQRLAAIKGVSADSFASGMKAFAQQVYEAASGSNSLAQLLRVNNKAIEDQEKTLYNVAELVGRARTEIEKQVVLRRAGLPDDAAMVRFMTSIATEGNRAAETVKKIAINKETLDGARQFDEKLSRMWDSGSAKAKSWANSAIDAFSGIANSAPFRSVEAVATLWQRLGSGGSGTTLGARARQSRESQISDRVPSQLPSLGLLISPVLPQSRPTDSIKDNQALEAANRLEQQRIQLLGELATVDDKVRGKQLELDQAYINNGVSVEKFRTRIIELTRAQAVSADSQAVVGALGNAATMTEKYNARVDALNATMATGKLTQEQYNRAIEGFKLDDAVAKAEAGAAAFGSFATSADKFNVSYLKLLQQQKQGLITQAEFNAGLIQSVPVFKAIGDAAIDFGAKLVEGLARGQNSAEILRSSLQSLGSQLIKIGTQDIIGSLFQAAVGGTSSTVSMSAGATAAATILTTAGTSIAASMVAGATSAASILGLTIPTAAATLPVAGAATGGEVAIGGAAAGAALTAGGTAAGTALWGPIAALAAIAAGVGLSFLSKSNVKDNSAQIAAQAQQSLATAQKQLAEAAKQTTAAISDLSRGIRNVNLADQIARLQAPLQELQDAAIRTQSRYLLSVFQQTAGEVQQKTAALIDAYVQSFYVNAGELDDVQQKLEQLKEDAQQLKDVGVALSVVNDAMTAAKQPIIVDFLGSIQQQLNDLSGSGYLNSVNDVLKSVANLRKDAADLGTSSGTNIDKILVLSMQKIIDESQLTGDAFDAVKASIGDLGSQLHEFNDTAHRSVLEVSKVKQSYQDQLFTITQDQNTLAGALAVFDLNAQRQREDEIKSGGEAINDLESLLAAQRLDIIKKFGDDAAQKAKEAADAELAAKNSAAKSIVEYVNGLLTGQSSPLSPTARLSAAQSAYNSQLTLAQGGNIDAYNSITKYAEDLRLALSAVYGSSAAYQAGFSTLTSQLVALPAVQQATDPVVVELRNVITAQQATTAAVSDAKTVLTAAINLGSASQTAAALATYFNTLDTDVNGLIDFNEMKTALGGMVDDSRLRDMFTRLDTDNSGALSKLDLQNTNLSGINTSVGGTTTAVGNVTTAVGGTTTAVGGTTTAVGLTTAAVDALKSIQNDSAAQLQLLNRQLTAGAVDVTYTPSVGGSLGGASVSFTLTNNMITALNKIVYNTGQTVNAVRQQFTWVTGAGWIGYDTGLTGTFARGGWITGGTPGVDSVRLVSGDLGMPGEFVVRRDVAQANASWLDGFNRTGRMPSNDNSIVAELRALRAENAEMRREIARLASIIAAGAEHVREGVDRVHDATRDGVRGAKLAV